MADIWDGIIIGGAGGAIAGLTVSFVRYVHGKALDENHKCRIYDWLNQNTSDEEGNQYRSTRSIASWNTSRSFMAEPGREDCVQEQDCRTYCFQVIINNSPGWQKKTRVKPDMLGNRVISWE